MTEIEKARFEFVLHLGDNALILSQRLSELCAHGPVLEEDIAITNIALDLLGQARMLLSYAAKIENAGRDEDALAYLRDVNGFRNALLTEQPNGDYAQTMARQFFMDAFHYHLYSALQESQDEELQSISAKALKEATYHLRHSSQWMLRMGDGTEESHDRLQQAINILWMYAGNLFEKTSFDDLLVFHNIIPDMEAIKSKWHLTVRDILSRATIIVPDSDFTLKGSREGIHTEHLGHMLSEMQFLQRAYPGNSW
jgi:ring-1,2-phenylacetyl-CoA epoxidase subunit PaaC